MKTKQFLNFMATFFLVASWLQGQAAISQLANMTTFDMYTQPQTINVNLGANF